MPEIAVRRRHLRFERDRAFAVHDRFVEALQLAQYLAEVGMEQRDIAVDLHRLLNQFGGQCLFADLMRDHAEQMQRECMVRLLLQDLQQQMLGFLQSCLRLELRRQRHRLFQRKLR